MRDRFNATESETSLRQRIALYRQISRYRQFFRLRIFDRSIRCLDRHRLTSKTTETTATATMLLWPLAFCLRVITSHRKPITTFSLKNSDIGRQIRQIEAQVPGASTTNGTERISFVYKFRLPLASTRKRQSLSRR